MEGKSYVWPQFPSVQTVVQQELMAPEHEGVAFIGRGGWLGIRCPCGYVASGRSMASLELGLVDHQEQATCPAYESYRMPTDDDV